MDYAIYESLGISGKRLITETETFEDAEHYVRKNFTLVCFEPDDSYLGCADAFTIEGMIISIERVN